MTEATPPTFPPLTMARTYAAPAARVFAAWTDPAKLRVWMASPPWRTGEVSTDPRPGGRYRIEVVSPEGEVHATVGEYREVAPPRRLVKTWVYEGPFAKFRGFETLLTVELRELGPELTELTLTHARLRDEEERAQYHEGWTACLDDLGRLLEVDA